MLPDWAQMLFMLLSQAWSNRRDAKLCFLHLQVELLKQRIPGNRVILSPDERKRLHKLGGLLNHYYRKAA